MKSVLQDSLVIQRILRTSNDRFSVHKHIVLGNKTRSRPKRGVFSAILAKTHANRLGVPLPANQLRQLLLQLPEQDGKISVVAQQLRIRIGLVPHCGNAPGGSADRTIPSEKPWAI